MVTILPNELKTLTKEQILALSNIKGVGPSAILKIGDAIARRGRAVTSDAELVAVAGAKQVTMEALQVAHEVTKQQIECAEREGIGLVGYYDDDFPSMLRETVDEDGKHKPPVLLWYRGDLSVASMPGVAIIGTREPSPEGLAGGKYIAAEFAKRGINIVSGLALGCDTCGHEGALSVGGKTTAFLANGLDWKSIYPKENLDLAKRIVASGGLLLSEYPIGQGVSRFALVARDRLQAGLARATVVVQTGAKGGTMHAAKATHAAGKRLFVLKFKDEAINASDTCAGNKLLVEKQWADYITGAVDMDALATELKAKVNDRNLKQDEVSFF